ncbi:MAG: hypothetical protein P1P86_15075 [Bacteroidales bacterium]|nr:hypothetical protein [Bacteroidales bacterium]
MACICFPGTGVLPVIPGREGRYGPPLNGLYRKEIFVECEGVEKTIVADREYFNRAITDPDYVKVLEYKTRIMTKPVITEDEVISIVDFLIGLGEEE